MSALSSDVCPRCRLGFLTLPRVCEGYHSPDAGNEGRSYQKCQFNNFHPQNNPCQGYVWRDDIPRQTSQPNAVQTPVRPPAALSTPASTPVSTPTDLSSSSYTPAPTPMRAARQRCENPKCTQRAASRNAKCVWRFCKTCCQMVPVSCPAPRHNDPPTQVLNSFTTVASPLPTPPQTAPSSFYRFSPPLASDTQHSQNMTSTRVPFSFEKPMGRQVDLAYVQKVHNGHHELAAIDNFRRESYRKTESTSLKIRLWVKDAEPGVALVVSNPAVPWFHPKDCETITRRIAPETCANFEYWVGEWVLTDIPIKIKPATEILLLRLPGVTNCLDGPRPKRRLSSASFQNETPRPTRPRLPLERPPISPLTYNLKESSHESTPDPDREDDDEVEIVSQNDSVLPTSRSPALSSPTRSIGPAPPPCSKFPLDFACDMDTGFKTMAAMAGTIPKKFTETFKVSWASSTYYTHHNIWATMDRDALVYAVQCGRGAGGNWQTLVNLYGKGKAKANN
ncbi:hypothetical protein K438DRAFT_1788707 [Mycena galopus ATCC 62051]|nr:hypothetical protein K438DRAFT_1788707 [Mycena galopus ATCC 62051]